MDGDRTMGMGGHRIVAIGVGGAGCRVVHSVHTSLKGVETIAINSDSVKEIEADKKIQIGTQILHGLGADASCEIGKKCAEESKELIASMLGKADLVIIIAGLGGGIGTGASPIIAEIAKNAGALVICMVIMPMSVENRSDRATQGLEILKSLADSVVTVSLDSILNSLPDIEFFDALNKVNELVIHLITKICESVTIPTLVNPDEEVPIGKEITPIIFYNSGKNDAHATSFSSPIYDVDYINESGAILRFSPEPNISTKNVSFLANAMFSELGDSTNLFLGGNMRALPKGKFLSGLFFGMLPPLQLPHIEDITQENFKKEN